MLVKRKGRQIEAMNENKVFHRETLVTKNQKEFMTDGALSGFTHEQMEGFPLRISGVVIMLPVRTQTVRGGDTWERTRKLMSWLSLWS